MLALHANNNIRTLLSLQGGSERKPLKCNFESRQTTKTSRDMLSSLKKGVAVIETKAEIITAQ